MKLRNLLYSSGAVLLALGLNACSTLVSDNRAEAVASYISHPIQLDGKLDDPAWYKTPAYPLVHADEQFSRAIPEIRKFFRKGVVEPGKVRLLWNDRYLYVGLDLTDTDLIAESPAEQTHLCARGDAVEVFLKPARQTWYWELYVTPKGQKTSYFYPGRGLRELPSVFSAKPALKGMIATANFKGTLNNSWDKDRKWTAVIAIPLAELAMAGEKLDMKTPWLILVGRCNYGRYLACMENSAFPSQPVLNYHAHADYARLKLVKGSD